MQTVSSVLKFVRLVAGSVFRLGLVLAIAGLLIYGLFAASLVAFGCWMCESTHLSHSLTAPTNDAMYAGEIVTVWEADDGWDDRVTLRLTDSRVFTDLGVEGNEDGTLVVRLQTNAPRWFSPGDRIAVFAGEDRGWIRATYIHDLATDSPKRRPNGSSLIGDVGGREDYDAILDCLAERHQTQQDVYPRLEALVTTVRIGGFADCRDRIIKPSGN